VLHFITRMLDSDCTRRQLRCARTSVRCDHAIEDDANRRGEDVIKFGRCRFYADENIEAALITRLRQQRFQVLSASELGHHPRDDRFHLQEARRRKAVLLTHDLDFLDHELFPFRELKDIAIVVIRATSADQFWLMMTSLIDLAYSGNQNLYGLKVEIASPLITSHARLGGRITSDKVDIRSPTTERDLFTTSDAVPQEGSRGPAPNDAHT
jgi:predicted nuclease of predicted toxin-antitoxin system